MLGHLCEQPLEGSPYPARLGRNRVLDRRQTIDPALAPPGATPTTDGQKRRIADFETLGEALDYAALGRRGLNFHDARGSLR
jgi:fatty-acyl-CoA synthase